MQLGDAQLQVAAPLGLEESLQGWDCSRFLLWDRVGHRKGARAVVQLKGVGQYLGATPFLAPGCKAGSGLLVSPVICNLKKLSDHVG